MHYTDSFEENKEAIKTYQYIYQFRISLIKNYLWSYRCLDIDHKL